MNACHCVIFSICHFFFKVLMKAAVKARAQVGTEWQKTNSEKRKNMGFIVATAKKPNHNARLKTVEIVASKNLRRKKLQEKRPEATMSG